MELLDAILVAIIVGVWGLAVGFFLGLHHNSYDGEFTVDAEHPENCNLILHKEIKDVTEMKRLNLKVIGVKKDETKPK